MRVHLKATLIVWARLGSTHAGGNLVDQGQQFVGGHLSEAGCQLGVDTLVSAQGEPQLEQAEDHLQVIPAPSQ